MKALPILYAGAGIAAAAVGLAIAWKVNKTGAAAADAAREVLRDLDPTNANNVIKRQVDKVVQAATGEPDATLGGKIYEWLHPGETAAQARISDPVVLPAKQTEAHAAASLGELGINTDELPGAPGSLLAPYTPFWYGGP
jgi:hypothetical protein